MILGIPKAVGRKWPPVPYDVFERVLLVRLNTHSNLVRLWLLIFWQFTNSWFYLNGRDCSNNCGWSKTMSYQRKVRQMTLDVGIKNWLRSGVTEGGPVLIQQIHQLLHDHLGEHDHVLPPVLVHGVVAAPRPRHVLRDLPSWEFRFTHIPKISR